jgi:hypothetical protein
MLSSIPALIYRSCHQKCTFINQQLHILRDRVMSVVDGTRKREVCDWWVHHIENRSDEYLQKKGYIRTALSENYPKAPPKNQKDVLQNVILIQSILDPSNVELDQFMVEVMAEGAVVFEDLRRECLYVLESDERVLGLHSPLTGDQRATVKENMESVLKVKAIDLEILCARQKSSQNKLTYASENEKLQLNATDVMPMSGVITARFHIAECEHLASLEIWGWPKSAPSSTRLKTMTISQQTVKEEFGSFGILFFSFFFLFSIFYSALFLVFNLLFSQVKSTLVHSGSMY